MWRTGPVAPQQVGSSQTGVRTRVGRRILNHCATEEVPERSFLITGLSLFLFLQTGLGIRFSRAKKKNPFQKVSELLGLLFIIPEWARILFFLNDFLIN